MQPGTQHFATGPVSVDGEVARSLAALLGDALGGGMATDAVPIIYPSRWFAGDGRLGTLTTTLLAGGQVPVHSTQSWASSRAMEIGSDYNVAIAMTVKDDLKQISATSAVTRSDGTAVSQSSTSIRVFSMEQLQSIKAIDRPETPLVVGLSALGTKPLGQDIVSAYAALADDHSPVHQDIEFARALGLESTIVHGMMIAGLAEVAIGQWFSRASVSRLAIRFLYPVYTGEALTLHPAMPRGTAEPGLQRLRVLFANPQDKLVAMADIELQE